ncbi:MAG TPA: aminotransferase class I and II, partial [Blastocatellia bacterium]|nr:aminotransferase class I and II [Blastocatellia bacterium]
YFHHTWDNYRERSRDPFPLIKDHVLLPFASNLREADAKMTGRVTSDIIDRIVKLIPDAWLVGDSAPGGGNQYRDAYVEYLLNRLEPPHAFMEEAILARSRYV